MKRAFLRGAVALLALVLSGSLESSRAEDLPPGVTRIVPRGKIRAIVEPEFVSADKAEIPSDAWVLGVATGGEARAYDLNLMNRHEVVNDRIGDQPFAAVWCPLANAGVAYDRRGPDGELTFEASGCLQAAAIVMQDQETDTWWSFSVGRAIGGKHKGTRLELLPIARKTTWATWSQENPNTVVLSVNGVTHVEENPYKEYFASTEPYQGIRPADDRLEPRTPVFVFWDKEGNPIVVPHERIEGGRTFAPDGGLEVDTPNVFLLRRRGTPVIESTRAYWFPQEFKMDPTTNPKRLLLRIEETLLDPIAAESIGVARLVGFDTYWYNWASQHEGSRLE